MTTAYGIIPAIAYGRDVADPTENSAGASAHLDVTIAPSAPAGPKAVWIVALLFVLASLPPTVMFVRSGAWPILGFFLLDAILIATAFRLAFRRARYAERLWIDDHRVHLIKTAPSGRRAVWTFPAHAVRVDFDGEAHANAQLGLVHQGGCVRFAACLAPDERRALAQRVRTTLAPFALSP